MSHVNENELRWLAVLAGLPEDDKRWSEGDIKRWIVIVHEYENQTSVERLRNQLAVRRQHYRPALADLVRI